jgi:2-amino-4-hydroxy-6-hydroxymethyldihydropteridine diphosphokinase
VKNTLASILLGSNQGDSRAVFEKTHEQLTVRCGTIVKKSALYETEPWGFESNSWFLNQVVLLDSFLPANELLNVLHQIEADFGRIRTTENGYSSRIIDLDILYFGNEIQHNEQLKIPHPRLHLRKFTLLPLCEIAPDFVHPALRKTNKMLLEELADNNVVRKLDNTF